MTRFVGDDSPQSRMRIARNAAEVVLYGIREISIQFDRAGVAATIQQAIFCIYRALDAGPDSMVQPEALAKAASLLGAAREGLLRTSAKRSFQIERASDILADASLHAQAASEAVAFDQLDRRMELPWGEAEASREAEPFRASIGEPGLHAPRRDAVEPHIDLGVAEPEPEFEVKVALAKIPDSIDALKAMARDLFATMQEPPPEEETNEGEPELAPTLPVGDVEAERQMAAEIARDAIEDIASLGSLRHPIETESWLDQAPFEQRLLNRLDHFCSLGVEGLTAAVLYHAESESPDSARAFALAFVLGCVNGIDTIDAIVTTIRQSPPETYPGFVEGLVLATNPNLDGAMRLLLGMNDVKLVGLAVDVLAQRRTLDRDDLEWALGSGDPRVEWLVARALGANLEQEQAFEHLERIYTRVETGSDLHLTAIESGIRRCQPAARQELRRILARPMPGAGTGRAAALLGLSGNARDFELLLGAAQVETSPVVLEGLGRLGHAGAKPYLLHLIDEQDEVLAPAAAKELERITGAGLIDEAEEPWVKELPPEAAEMDVPVPMKKLRRVTTSPERWRNWERANGQRFDPLKKHRAGAPFAPPQLLAELEALEPRADERERSALELSSATGKDFGFRSNDWVQGQQRSFGRMRQYFERHSFEAGAWCFAGAGIAARPEGKLDPGQVGSRRKEAALPWQFDVVSAAETSEVAAKVVDRVPVIEGQAEIPDFLRVAKTAAAPPVVAPMDVPVAAPPPAEVPISPAPIAVVASPVPVAAAAAMPEPPPAVVPSGLPGTTPNWGRVPAQPPPPVVAPASPPAMPARVEEPPLPPIPAQMPPAVAPQVPALVPPPPVQPAPQQKRAIAPATFFDAKVSDLLPGVKPLKKLPWEK